eukprot:CAMPEP_0185028404 /NCGR_PEP_ID=MMETSP1103-20130426/14067_1 /TAXON_ID=36769 /ORGANISM="Paraphysomonas bandaiensis, Strain Caron Lab Isolate" /LENGTH=290 /DNA_ID=CAMNT_0027562807 /DNA_START=92 /DNA_END=964 /DNA_ORIENTATION=+
MAYNLCKEYQPAYDMFEEASSILQYNLLSACTDGPQSYLDKTEIAQVAIFVSSMATLEKLKHQDRETYDSCTIAAGLSLGEYSALCFAGAFSFADGVRITHVRGKTMQVASDREPSGMMAILGLEAEVVENMCKSIEVELGQHISIGNYLCSKNYVVSGSASALNLAADRAMHTHGARRVIPLPVAGAFHTSYMASAQAQLCHALDSVTFHPTRIPVVANVNAEVHNDVDSTKQALLEQVVRPVQWESSMLKIIKSSEFQRAYEIGPGRVCAGILKSMNRRLKVISIGCD